MSWNEFRPISDLVRYPSLICSNGSTVHMRSFLKQSWSRLGLFTDGERCQINIEREFANPFSSLFLRKEHLTTWSRSSFDCLSSHFRQFNWSSENASHSSGTGEKLSRSREEGDSEVSRNQTQRLRTKGPKTSVNEHEREGDFSWKPSQSTASVPTQSEGAREQEEGCKQVWFAIVSHTTRLSLVFRPLYSKHTLTKAVKRVVRVLPGDRDRQQAVVKRIGQSLGLFGKSNCKRSTPNLSEAVRKQVVDFYMNDSISWQAPGKRDCLTVRQNGIRVQHQKRFLLFNIRECHALFVQEHPGMR